MLSQTVLPFKLGTTPGHTDGASWSGVIRRAPARHGLAESATARGAGSLMKAPIGALPYMERSLPAGAHWACGGGFRKGARFFRAVAARQPPRRGAAPPLCRAGAARAGGHPRGVLRLLGSVARHGGGAAALLHRRHRHRLAFRSHRHERRAVGEARGVVVVRQVAVTSARPRTGRASSPW